MKEVLEALHRLEATETRLVGYRQTEIILEILGVEPPEGSKYQLGSALVGEGITQGFDHEQLAIIQAKTLVAQHPEMKTDPLVEHLESRLDAKQRGIKEANRLYALYSRSIDRLLKAGLLRSDIRGDIGETFRNSYVDRWFRALYELTEAGRAYLPKR